MEDLDNIILILYKKRFLFFFKYSTFAWASDEDDMLGFLGTNYIKEKDIIECIRIVKSETIEI